MAEKGKYVKQHPKNIDSKDHGIISYMRPARVLSERYTIHEDAIKMHIPDFKSPTGSRIVRSILVGPTNAGKSTLINKLIGSELTAVSNKVCTTDEVDKYFTTEGLTQMIFMDTPGAIKANNSIKNRRLVTK